MSKRNCYVLEEGTYNNHTEEYFMYVRDVFSSNAGAHRQIKNRIEVNKGYEVSRDKLNDDVEVFNYKCLCTEGNEMKVRYVLTRRLIRVA